METQTKTSNLFENALFMFLGALSATMISLGVFGSIESRTPASISPTQIQSDFDARVYLEP